MGATPDTIRVTPRTRYEALADLALPALKSRVIEAFLAEPLIVDANELQAAPRIVATQEERVLLTRGDRAYARGSNGAPLMDDQAKQQLFRLFRNATPLKDPGTGEILGYEAQYIGKAQLIRSETTGEVLGAKGQPESAVVPATIDIVSAKEEIRVGDRMLPEPARDLATYTPHAPYANCRSTHRVGVWQCRDQCRSKPGGRHQPGHPRWHGSRPCAGHPEGRPAHHGQDRPDPATHETAQRAQRLAYGVPHVRPRVLRADSGNHRQRACGRPLGQPTLRQTHGNPTAPSSVERDELSAWLRLLLTPGVGSSSGRKLLARFGLPQEIFAQSAAHSWGLASAPNRQTVCAKLPPSWLIS